MLKMYCSCDLFVGLIVSIYSYLGTVDLLVLPMYLFVTAVWLFPSIFNLHAPKVNVQHTFFHFLLDIGNSPLYKQKSNCSLDLKLGWHKKSSSLGYYLKNWNYSQWSVV